MISHVSLDFTAANFAMYMYGQLEPFGMGWCEGQAHAGGRGRGRSLAAGGDSLEGYRR